MSEPCTAIESQIYNLTIGSEFRQSGVFCVVNETEMSVKKRR